MDYKAPSALDRVISGLSYLTGGMAGFIWLIVCVVRKAYPDRFLSYHIMQSIFIYLCYIVVNAIFWFIVNLLGYVPFVNRVVRQLIYIFNHPIFFGYSFVQVILYSVILYLAVFAFMGLYSYLPGVSNIVMNNIRR